MFGTQTGFLLSFEKSDSLSQNHVVHNELTSFLCCGNEVIFVFYCIICICNFQSSEDCTAWLKCVSWWGSINTLADVKVQQHAQTGSLCRAGCDDLLRHTGMRMSSKTWGASYGTIELSLSPSRSSPQQACHLEINCYAASSAY